MFTLQKLTFVVCALLRPGHVGVACKVRAVSFGNRILSSHSEETRRVKFFGILKQLKKPSKFNDVHAQNEMFLSSTERPTIAAENSRYRM